MIKQNGFPGPSGKPSKRAGSRRPFATEAPETQPVIEAFHPRSRAGRRPDLAPVGTDPEPSYASAFEVSTGGSLAARPSADTL